MIAVIDIGTNTMKLLIARKEGHHFISEHFDRLPAKLGKGGMKKGILTEDAIQRSIEILSQFKTDCETRKVDRIKVTATSAVRSASNGREFVAQVKTDLGLEIEVIDGEREADLIWKGVKLTGLLDGDIGLIMDIGGGSTEFILADNEEVIWKKSYDLGVTRIAERFQSPDPFDTASEMKMNSELDKDMSELWQILRYHPVKRLIGASGSFNSISLMLAQGEEDLVPEVWEQIEIDRYKFLSERLRRSDFDTRSVIPGLVPDRVDTISYSALLIDLVLKKGKIQALYRSTYALKEGLMDEIMNN
ncbi:MAG: phosphatase [Flavobacteriales bacterium]|nr:phosphatase [Flavobacteriales bacterium]NNK81340.1 phosphatase [Flavobacteriales bacterium]